ncbi:MAG: PLP-dependent aminotransferase family protein [Defluviitaleaceae bacterium]|nr:PLP-dependent aminotransferase family protein [Defluviitaleaceae bacterium]MCL2273523.1 PLP-dependent aminotransferase family protein [Defluviitaleaceae bacterium]
MKLHKYKQLAAVILSQIDNGAFSPHSKLPPIRQLAATHGVNSATAVNAYRYLEQLGRIYSRTGSGVYVSPPMPKASDTPVDASYINFAAVDTEAIFFPAQEFGQAVNDVLTREGKNAFTQYDARGYAPLRTALAKEADVHPQQIILLHTAHQGRAILSKIKLHALPIIEDTESDFYYGKAPPVIVKNENGIFLKSYAKILMSGIAYMVVPKSIADECAKLADTSTAGLLQKAFAQFLTNGGFAAHAAHMRRVYGRRYKQALLAAKTYLADYYIIDETQRGLALALRPTVNNDWEAENLCQRLLQRKVIVSPIDGIRLSFCAVQEERIAEGIGIIAAMLATP